MNPHFFTAPFLWGEWIFWGEGTVSFSSPYPCFEFLQKTFIISFECKKQ